MEVPAAKPVARDAVLTEAFVWALDSLCRLHRVPFDAELVLKQFPPPYDLPTLLRAAQACGLKAGLAGTQGDALERLPLPCLGFVRSVGSANDPAPPTVALLVRADRERLLYLLAGEEAPRTMARGQFAERFEDTVLLAAPAIAAPDDPDGAQKRAFGFRWFVPELARHRAIWRDVLLASAAIQIVGLATPLFTQLVIDKVVVHQTQSTLIAIAAGLGIFLVFNAAITWMRQYLVLHTGNRVDAVLATQVFAHLFRLPLPYYEHRATGTTVARLQGVETIREFITGAAVSFVLDLPFLLIILAVMFIYSWQLSLIALGIVLLLTITSLVVTPLLREKLNKQFLLGARNQAFVTEYVSGVETVKSLQFEPLLERRYGDYLSTYLAASFGTRNLANTYNVVANALEQLMTLSILVAGALLVMRNDGFTIGMLVAFQMFAARMAQPMLRIAGLWQEFQQASIAVKRLGDIMNAPAEPHSLAPSRAPGGTGALELQALSFRYSERHPYLFRNVAFSLKPGELVLISGASGSGKSTLAKLLLGFYQPSDGRILLDGRDLAQLAANELRQTYGVVPQDTLLFSGTVYENVAMANPHARFDDIVTACRAAEMHDVIEKLPQGYQTPLGEHGIGLSGGQKQRLAIARALLKRPKVLIFDEATSNLDPATAESLARTINHLKGKATIVFIAHQVPPGLQIDRHLSFNRP
ncbi:MAG TPA: peptidase domain-containing ABC transporter [Burkholderiales bacterium]|nr:peptidase domain-containing ABC transporter [Burkholderiales bacterium]